MAFSLLVEVVPVPGMLKVGVLPVNNIALITLELAINDAGAPAAVPAVPLTASSDSILLITLLRQTVPTTVAVAFTPQA